MSVQVKSRAAALLKKHPLSQCSMRVQADAAEAERSRHARRGRKRFGGRYTGGFWPADGGGGGGNGRTPYHPSSRPSRFHDAGLRLSSPLPSPPLSLQALSVVYLHNPLHNIILPLNCLVARHPAGRKMSAGARHKVMRTPQIHRPESFMSPSFGGPPPGFTSPAPPGFMSPAPAAAAENGHRDFVSPQPPPLLHFDHPFSPVRLPS